MTQGFELTPLVDKADYNRLPAADRTLVDRALFGEVVSTQGGFQFTAAERRQHGGENPKSGQVERDIWRLRDQYAERLQGGGDSARQNLRSRGASAPANATQMLNAINAFNNDECGCGGPGIPINLNQVLAPFRNTGGQSR